MLCSNIDRDNGAHNQCIAQVTKIGVLQVVNSNEDARNQNRKTIILPSPIPAFY